MLWSRYSRHTILMRLVYQSYLPVWCAVSIYIWCLIVLVSSVFLWMDCSVSQMLVYSVIQDCIVHVHRAKGVVIGISGLCWSVLYILFCLWQMFIHNVPHIWPRSVRELLSVTFFVPLLFPLTRVMIKMLISTANFPLSWMPCVVKNISLKENWVDVKKQQHCMVLERFTGGTGRDL